MSEHSKHTRGPWVVDDEAQIIGGGNVIARAEPRQYTPENAWDWDTAFANAHLMAAAPDLLACVKELLDMHAAHHNDPAHAAARALIAKATQ